jgi:hemolysin activation/secretion protein
MRTDWTFRLQRPSTDVKRCFSKAVQTGLGRTALKSSLFLVVLFPASQRALAAPPVGAGGQIQQIPQAPALQQAPPEFQNQQSKPWTRSTVASPKFLVKSLHVTGQTHFSEAELIAATDFKPDSKLDLADLQAMASKITDLYNRNGYFVAQAYLPPQDVTNGSVTIAVIEGRYDKISLDNQTTVSDYVFNDVLDGINVGDAVVIDPLERRLLIISDIPGVEVKSTLAPGSAIGTSDLTVGVTPGPWVIGSVEADNAGNPYTGVYRLGATTDFNEPSGIGDVISARFLGSTTGDMDYGRVSYEAQVEDGRVGGAFTTFEYRLGRNFSRLQASGSEDIASLYGSYPLIRSYNDNLYVLLDFDYRAFQDKIDAADTVTDKHAWVAMPGLSGDHHDMFGGGGWDSYSLTASIGELDIQSPLARELDAATARTNGVYAKLYLSASRLQQIVGPLSLYGLVRGQIASKNLDDSEQMELGGAYGVRAYPEGEVYGDEGYIATLEARLQLPRWFERLPGDTQLLGFVDTGTVTLNTSRWNDDKNIASRSGAGVGLTWAATNNFEASVTYAWKLGNTEATSAPDRFGGFWFQVVKDFSF